MRNRVTVLLAAVVLVAPMAACGSDDESADSTTTTSEETTTTTAVPWEKDPSAASVYWAWSVPTVSTGTPERLGVGGRVVDPASPARGAVEALLAGPDATETEIGMGTEIPEGTTLLDLDIADGVATVDLSPEFETPSGTLSETMRLAQVVFTLTQYPTSELVKFRIGGADVDAVGSHGIVVGDGLDRDDFADVRPMILLETPFPGATIQDGFHLTGQSNTFEANVQWTVTDSEGLIVAEGFTTATGGNGTWGTFDEEIDIPDDLTGRGSVIVFDVSAEDGSQADVVEYPVTFGTA